MGKLPTSDEQFDIFDENDVCGAEELYEPQAQIKQKRDKKLRDVSHPYPSTKEGMQRLDRNRDKWNGWDVFKQ